MARRRRDKRRRGGLPAGRATADRAASRNDAHAEGAAPADPIQPAGAGTGTRNDAHAEGAAPGRGQGTGDVGAGPRNDAHAEGAAPDAPPAPATADPRQGTAGRSRQAGPDAPRVRATRGPPSRPDAHRKGAAPDESAGGPAAKPPSDPDAARETAPSRERSTNGRRSAPRRRWLAWAAGAAAVAVLYAGAAVARQAIYAARLPALPELSEEPTALRAHLEAADRAARDRPTSAEAVGALGRAYHADLFLDHADRAYAAAEALSGGAWRWTYYRALAAGTRGDTGALTDGLRRVVAAAPDFGPAWWRLGEAEFKAGRYDRATEAWRRALPLDEWGPASEPAGASGSNGLPQPAPGAPVSAYAALGLARIALVRGNARDAASRLEDVTAAAPGFGPAFRLLGDAYASLDRVEDASRALQTADRLPQYEAYLDPLSEALVRESRSTTFLLQQAATADLTTNAPWREYLIRRALEFDPDHPVALAELATTFRLLRRYEEALELLEGRRREHPDDFGVLADIGRCLSALGRYGEAEEMLRRALGGLDNAPTRYELGLALDGAGRLREAIAEYQRALDRNPNHRGTLNNLGVALANLGRMDEAARHFERLLAFDPENADAHANLGLALAATGARAAAARALREALRLDPDHAGARGGLEDMGLR